MEINELLKIAVKGKASDIHIKVGMPPIFRVNGSLVPLKGGSRVTGEQAVGYARAMMKEGQWEKFQENRGLDSSYAVPGVGRFRVSIFYQRNSIGLVFRVVPFRVFSVDELGLPEVIKKIAMEHRGLILVTGTTGSGKSTTLAAMIDYINNHRTAHILTIEDPIEFLIRDKRSIINQREIGVDSVDFSSALRGSLRQDPDVILVGEMRDLETIETVIKAAETGHLVMSTVHTLDATETINRIVSVFPGNQQKQVRLQLASVLKGVISQRLVPKANGKGRVAACEILVGNSRVRSLIEEEERTRELYDTIKEGFVSYGMQTFDQSLMNLVKQKHISYEEALKQATNPDDFALEMRGISSNTASSISVDDFQPDETQRIVIADDDDFGNLDLDDLKIDKF
ncbi:MAG: type IV pilus twitching motility protein PilT [Deltaproteobacteria bacterium]|nr:type IV pilus twitching motility protein PilT [Deltaproteobacteria bacterium]